MGGAGFEGVQGEKFALFRDTSSALQKQILLEVSVFFVSKGHTARSRAPTKDIRKKPEMHTYLNMFRDSWNILKADLEWFGALLGDFGVSWIIWESFGTFR